MKSKQYIVTMLFLLIISNFCYGITRNQVVLNALNWEYTDDWTPQIDTVIFGALPNSCTFQSNFLTSASGGTPPYNVEAYVYGGEDSELRFVNRINNRMCPGGNNISPGGYNTKWFYDNGYNPASRLAGIDCSAFVSACWGVRRENTRTLLGMCLQLDGRDKIKPGDILDYPGSHVILVLTKPEGGKIDTAESTPPNVVAIHGRSLSSINNYYGAYTPFPQFSGWNILEEGTIYDTTPNIEFTIRSGTNIIASSIEMKIDEEIVSPILSPSTDAKVINVSYIQASDLSVGAHIVG